MAAGPSQIDSPENGNPDLEYYKIPIDLYHPGDLVEINLYLYYQGQYILSKKKGVRWSAEDTETLNNFGAKTFFVQFNSDKEHHEFLDLKIKTLLSKPEVAIERKASVLYDASEPILTRVYSTPKVAENIQSAANYVKNCMKFLTQKGSLPELIRLSSKSFTEHEHALHVSTYALALAKRLGNTNQDQLFALGLGGLLHDIGKHGIDKKILEKPGELTNEEWQEMRKHPQIGYDLIQDRKDIPALTKQIIWEHHERINGKGYPQGIKNPSSFSQMVAISDVFNALTSHTEYSTAKKPYDALQFMITFLQFEFDKKLLAAFIEMLSE